jgi:hypothetical protein
MPNVFVLSHHDIKVMLCYTTLRVNDCSVLNCPKCPLNGVVANLNVVHEAMELASRFVEARKRGISNIETVDRLGVQTLEDKNES